MRANLASHDAILREAVESHRGRVIKKTEDGLHASFLSALGALKTVIEAQKALLSYPWGLTGPLRIRMALKHSMTLESHRVTD